MLQNRQEKPISPDQMFERLLHSSYREPSGQEEFQKLKKQRIVLIQLIQEYQKSIQSELTKINQCDNLEKLKLEKIQQLRKLQGDRKIIDQSVDQQIARIALTPTQKQYKLQFINELQQVQHFNSKLRLKIRDLAEYAQKLQFHNQTLEQQKNVAQTKFAARYQVNSQDWRLNVENIRRRHQIDQNEYRTKVLEKETEQMMNIRKQQEQIAKRNEARWEEFRRTVQRPYFSPYGNSLDQKLTGLRTRQPYSGNIGRFRVI